MPQDRVPNLVHQVIETVEKRECLYYSHHFSKAAATVNPKKEPQLATIFQLLARITSIHLKPDNSSSPFTPKETIEHLTGEDLINLRRVLDKIDDPELKARVADILWIKERDFTAAQAAVHAYLESADRLEHPERWTSCASRIERALRLATLLGKKEKKLPEVIQHIQGVLTKYKGEDPLFFSATLMRLLLEHNKGDPKKLAGFARKAARRAADEGKWPRSREYWDLCSKWKKRADQKFAEREARKRWAQTFVQEAEIALSKKDFASAAHHFQAAVEAHRQIGKPRIAQELHRRLLKYQKKARNQLARISEEVDISPEMEKSRKLVQGHSLHEALLRLSLGYGPPSKKKLKRTAEESLADYVHTQFAVTILDVDGKVQTLIPGAFSTDATAREEALCFQMLQSAIIEQEYRAQAVVLPMIQQIQREHGLSELDFLKFVQTSKFIPPGREAIYAKGLNAGFNFDFMTAAHLLIPQVEHSVRTIMQSAERITSSVDSRGVQKVLDLNTMLYWSECEKLFGEDLAFDMQGLLVDKRGSNLRNQIAHGLLEAPQLNSLRCAYFWWQCLYLCVLPILSEGQIDQSRKKKKRKKKRKKSNGS